MGPAALFKGELDFVGAGGLRAQDFGAQRADVRGHVHGFELGVVGYAAEEGDGEARAGAGGGGEDAVRGAGADAAGERLEALADGDDEGAALRGAGDPFPAGVAGLQAVVGGGLEEVGG